MLRTLFARVSLKKVALVASLVSALLLGPVASESALPVDQGDVYAFGPTGVTIDTEVRLSYHNITKSPVLVVFSLLDATGKDLFALNNIPATSVVAPGAIAMGIVPCNGILGPNDQRVEVSGSIIVFTGPKPPPRGFSGPASLQIVDELSHKTLVTVGTVGPIDLPKYFGG